jgi:hypothetical protein
MPAFPSHRRVVLLLVLALGSLLFFSFSCSSAECDDSKCAAGNRCLVGEDGNKCRKTCSTNWDPSTSCPFGFTCKPHTSGVSYCAFDKVQIEKRDVGQWGASCNPVGGQDANPDCDSGQGFKCFGRSPSDAQAYCTRFGCTNDDECGAGFGCQAQNTTPNVGEALRQRIGEVVNVCVRRVYCSACRSDLDCAPLEGRKQRCTADDVGNTFCAPECTNNASCTRDAYCYDYGDYKACYPHAGVCVGDGLLCSPCRSDADCKDQGACANGSYTTERHCATKAPSDCQGGAARGGCPATAPNPKVQVACRGDNKTTLEVPPNYCHGVFNVEGAPAGIGCWSPNR